MKSLFVLLAFLAVVLASMLVRRRATGTAPTDGDVIIDGSVLHNRRVGDAKDDPDGDGGGGD